MKQEELRDHFAGLAMQAFLSDTEVNWRIPETQQRWAEVAYEVADFMIEAKYQK